MRRLSERGKYDMQLHGSNEIFSGAWPAACSDGKWGARILGINDIAYNEKNSCWKNILAGFFLFCKVFEEGFRKRKASELSEKKHWEKCMERVLGSHCNYIVCMPEKNQKTFLKPIALWAKMLYTNKACVRRWCGKLPCYRRISTENCPHRRWGRRDSLSFYCVKNIRNTRKRVQRRQNHVHVENSARSDDCGTKRSPQPKAS